MERPQRRKTNRFSLTPSLHVSVETPEGPSVPGTVRDLSEGGIGLAIQRPFEPGDELILEVADEPARRFLATARVIWSQPREGGLQHVGLEWTHQGPNRARVKALVQSAARGSEGAGSLER